MACSMIESFEILLQHISINLQHHQKWDNDTALIIGYQNPTESKIIHTFHFHSNMLLYDKILMYCIFKFYFILLFCKGKGISAIISAVFLLKIYKNHPTLGASLPGHCQPTPPIKNSWLRSWLEYKVESP